MNTCHLLRCFVLTSLVAWPAASLLSQNVGIGTNTPASKLTVNSDNSWIAGNFGNNNPNLDRVVIGNLFGKATIGAHTAALNNWDTLLLNPGGGHVGINTFAPTAPLDVNGKIRATTLQITAGALDGYVLRSDASGNAAWADLSAVETDPSVGLNTTNFLSKWNGTQLVASTMEEAGGNVRIGVAQGAPVPNARLQVNSANNGSGMANWIAANIGSSGATADRVVLGTLNGKATIGAHNAALNAWDTLVIHPDGGAVGIGLDNPEARLQVKGTMRLGGDGAVFDNITSKDIVVPASANDIPPNSRFSVVFNWPVEIFPFASIMVNPRVNLPGGFIMGHVVREGITQIRVTYLNFSNSFLPLPTHTLRVTVINFLEQ